MFRNLLMIVLMIVLVGIVGRFDYESEIMTHKQDEINKQEFIKDVQMKCFNGELSSEYCKGY